MSEHPGSHEATVILNVDDHKAARYAKSRVLQAAATPWWKPIAGTLR
jgi:hypothetical protein